MYNGLQDIHVFISYASEDQPIAQAIEQRLRALGLRCFIAYADAQVGASYGDMLYEAIAKAAVVVVLVSASSSNSLAVARELELADQMKKRIVPIRIDDSPPVRALAYYTAAAQWYSWWRTPELAIQKVIEQVKAGPITRGWR